MWIIAGYKNGPSHVSHPDIFIEEIFNQTATADAGFEANASRGTVKRAVQYRQITNSAAREAADGKPVAVSETAVRDNDILALKICLRLSAATADGDAIVSV